MRSYVSNWISLRKKITGLALIPALICSIVFGALIWTSSRSTARLVGEELTRFMAERTSRATIHGYNTSIVTYGYVMDALEADAQTAQTTLAKLGGVHLAGHTESWQAVNDVTHQTSTVTVPALALGSWQSSQSAGTSPLNTISEQTGRAVILYARMDLAGDMLRVAGASQEQGVTVDAGSYIPARLASGEVNPMAKTILAGSRYEGVLDELNSPHQMVCDPLREASGNVYGMVCVGLSIDTIRSLQQELKANYVGAHGSAAVFYLHGKYRGRALVEPSGDAKATESQWLQPILEKAQTLKDMDGDGVIVYDPVNKDEVIVRYSYFQKWDWLLVIVADSRDLQSASDSVRTEFHALLWKTFIAGIIALILTMLLALRISRKLIDPMADLAIRLTSNATQVASSARHQAANVANFNTSGNEIASAVKEISATSKELLRAMEQLAEDAEKTSHVANEGSQGLKGLGSSMESLSAATHSITDKLTTIRAKANKINAVVTAITKVADQTNLLSLNAAIEAEKAGEGGAGFAVVAREIRRLADQSAVATMEIEQMVEAMQEAVSSGVAQTRELTEAMERGIAASESISGQFGDIIQRVESMAPRYEAVHQGMQNQSEGAQQISEAMWQLTEMGRQTSESVNDLNEVSQQLHQAVRILKERIIQVRNAE